MDMDLVGMLEAVPATVWGFLVGSLVTVIGVALTNASNTKRLRLQHAHERAIAERARDLSLRRDVYLGAFDAIATGMAMVGNFSELDVPFQELMRSYMGKAAAIGRVTIVGEEGTIRAVADFEQALTGAFIRLAGQRTAVDQQFRRTQALATKIERSEAEQERLESLIEAGDDPAEGTTRLLAHERQRCEALRAEEREVEDAFTPALMQLVRATMEEVVALDRLLAPVIRCVRGELGLSFDEDFYVRLVEAGHAERAKHFEGFLSDAVPSG
jgi:hypothetical protein